MYKAKICECYLAQHAVFKKTDMISQNYRIIMECLDILNLHFIFSFDYISTWPSWPFPSF